MRETEFPRFRIKRCNLNGKIKRKTGMRETRMHCHLRSMCKNHKIMQRNIFRESMWEIEFPRFEIKICNYNMFKWQSKKKIRYALDLNPWSFYHNSMVSHHTISTRLHLLNICLEQFCIRLVIYIHLMLRNTFCCTSRLALPILRLKMDSSYLWLFRGQVPFTVLSTTHGG